MSQARTSTKVPYNAHDEEGETQDALESNAKANKFKKRDVDIPLAEADIKLAQKLDSCLNLGASRKPRFFMNKPNAASGRTHAQLNPIGSNLVNMGSIKPKNLSREELKERLAKKYDSLVPELNPKRVEVKLIKVVSVKESLEMGQEEAKRQLVDQMKLNSISGNQHAYQNGTESFRFKDGYEMQGKSFYSKKFDAFQKSKTSSSKTQISNVEKFDETESTRATSKDSTTGLKSVKFADQVHIQETSNKEFSRYDFFAPDEDEILTDDEEEEEQQQQQRDCTGAQD